MLCLTRIGGLKTFASGSSTINLIPTMIVDNSEYLQIVSFNCNSIRSKVDIIRDILVSCDILLCQEVILLPDESGYCMVYATNLNIYLFPTLFQNQSLERGGPLGEWYYFFGHL